MAKGGGKGRPRKRGNPKTDKRPGIGPNDPDPKKKPTHQPVTAGAPDEKLSWRFGDADKAGPFGWAELTCNDTHRGVIDKLAKFEKMTRQDIGRGGSHPVEVSKLCKEAQDRLVEIKRDDIDELMSFRLGGAPRVWCIDYFNVMQILWWDPDHKVCPWQVDPGDRRKANRRKRAQ